MIDYENILRDPPANYPPTTVACFDPAVGDLPRRRHDEARLGEYLRRLERAGATGLLIGASTGHGHLRTPQELLDWFDVVADAGLSTAAPIALLRPEDGLAFNERALARLKERRYGVVFFRPATDRRGATDDELFAELAPLVSAASQAGLLVGLYSISDVSGVRLLPRLAKRLLASPGGERIVAVKTTESDYDQGAGAYLADPAFARIKIVQGWDPHLARALRDGGFLNREGDDPLRPRVGWTSGAMAFAVHQFVHIAQLAADARWEEIEQAQAALTVVFRSMQDDPAKFADLQRAKWIMGLGHPLTGEVSAAHAEAVLAALESLPPGDDRRRLAASLNLMGDGPFAERLSELERA